MRTKKHKKEEEDHIYFDDLDDEEEEKEERIKISHFSEKGVPSIVSAIERQIFLSPTCFRKLSDPSYSEAAFKHLNADKKEKTNLNITLTEENQAIEQGQTLLEDAVFTAYEISVHLLLSIW